jgi:hypothetical protein
MYKPFFTNMLVNAIQRLTIHLLFIIKVVYSKHKQLNQHTFSIFKLAFKIFIYYHKL